MNHKINIGIFGYGNMGRAIAAQLKSSSLISAKLNLAVCSLGVGRLNKIRVIPSLDELLGTCRIIFLAVKPQDFYKLKPLAIANRRLIIISIMAGVKIANIKKLIPGARIVRTMPNLPLQIGQGVIGWHLRKSDFTASELKLLEQIFSSFGASVYLEDEKKLNAITAISGSGPAYVFLFIDALVQAAVGLGFSQTEALKIVRQTIGGSLSFAGQRDSAGLKELIQRVKSPGGTTAAALEALGVDDFYRRWRKATAKACERAEQLSAFSVIPAFPARTHS